VQRLRNVLDVLSTLALVAACVTFIWVYWFKGGVKTIAVPKEAQTLDGASIRGDKRAKVAIIEYSDFQCPFCGAFARGTLRNIEKKYVDEGRVLLAFRHNPLDSIHPLAIKAAEAAECAGQQGKFWEMHDSLFGSQSTLDEDSLRQRATTLHLNTSRFNECLSGEAAEKVQREQMSAAALGLSGTPTFLIGRVQSNGLVRVTRVIAGASSIQEFTRTLDDLLNSAS
jgi:protein-disulfide isomerase